jgi:branched-subunit amino acid transport protein
VSRPEVWLVIALAALVTLAERAAFLVSTSDKPLPPFLRRSLRYVPPAVFAAITLPALARPSGVALGPVDARVLAGVVAGLVAWRTKNITFTFLTGMACLWLLTWLVG